MTTAEHAHTQAPNLNPNFHHSDKDSLIIRMGKWVGEHKLLSGLGMGGLIGSVAAASVITLASDKERLASLHDQMVRVDTGAPEVPGQEATPQLTGDYDGNGVVTDEEYDRVPPEEFADLNDRTRVADVGAKLNQYMPSAYDEIQRHLSMREGAALYMPDINKPRNQWTDQDYLNYYTLGIYLVSMQGDQQSQIDEGRRALTVVMDPDHPNFSAVDSAIGNVNGVKSVYEAQTSPYSSKELGSGVRGGYSIGGEGGRLVLANYIPGDSSQKEIKQYMLFINRSDNEGNVVSILTDSFAPSDPRIKDIFQ